MTTNNAPADEDLFALHDEFFPTMVLGHENYLKFARTLLHRFGQPARPADAEFQLIQDGFIVAGAEGRRDQAWAEIQRYAAQYAEDGPVEIWEVTRRRIEGE